MMRSIFSRLLVVVVVALGFSCQALAQAPPWPSVYPNGWHSEEEADAEIGKLKSLLADCRDNCSEGETIKLMAKWRGNQIKVEVVEVQRQDAAAILAILESMVLKLNMVCRSWTGRSQQKAQPRTWLFMAFPERNAILVAVSEANFEWFAKEIRRLDAIETPIAFPIRLKRLHAQSVANTLNNCFFQRYSTEKDGPHVIFDDGTNTVFVKAWRQETKEIAALVATMDEQEAPATNEIRFIRLMSALSDDVALIINDAIAQGAIDLAAKKQRKGRLQFLSSCRKNEDQETEAAAFNDVRVSSIQAHNTLVVSAPGKSVDLVQELVRRLDVRPEYVCEALGTGPGPVISRVPDSQIAVYTLTRADVTTLAGAKGDFLRDLHVTITVDERTNSLIVAGCPNDLDVIEAIIYRLED